MRKYTPHREPEKIILLFADLSRHREATNLFALDDVIKRWRFPRYYRKMIELILWGVNPQVIANNLINDNSLLFYQAKSRASLLELIYHENILGYALYYLQKCIPPDELYGELQRLLLYMRNRPILHRNFSGSFYDRFYLE